MLNPLNRTNRRTFLLKSASTTAALGAASQVEIAGSAYTGAGDALKIGLVGCGGRGTGAAEQALTADRGCILVAMGDAFPDQLEASHQALKSSEVPGLPERVAVPPENRFTGFDAYQKVIDQVDLVLLTTPPAFRPEHFAYAVSKGKHAFIEKPVAVDAVGLRKFLDAAKESKAKGLSAVNGFCWRYYQPRREVMARVFGGEIGPVTSVETNYNSMGVWEPRKSRSECKTEMEYQMRNWYYQNWLSGDHIVEQAVHGLDTMAWALGDNPPMQCYGVGGRQARTDARYGNIFDHFSIVYEYPDDIRGYHQCRHWANTTAKVADYVQGTKGRADVFGKKISGTNKWRYRPAPGEKIDMYQAEHNEMFAALRGGTPINNAEQAATTTLLALMGRMAAYTGETITWQQALNSQESLVPAQLSWTAEAPQIAVAVPGVKKFA